MGVKFNPFTSKLDVVDSPDGDFSSLDISGDITLDDGGTYTTTVQVVTPTLDRTISFPDATGTVALVAGSSGQLTYNNAGSNAGLTSANIGSTGAIDISLAGADSTPPVKFTGSWFTGTAVTAKPQLLIEPSGTTSTGWSPSGTGLGVNAASGFGGRLLDLQTNGTSQMVVQGDGKLGLGISNPIALFHAAPVTSGGATSAEGIKITAGSSATGINIGANSSGTYGWIQSANWGTAYAPTVINPNGGNVGIASTAPGDKLEIGGAGAGIILASPDGTRYRLTVANGGTLSIAPV